MLREQEPKLFEVDRLDEVGVESGFARSQPIFFLAVAGEGYEDDMIERGLLPAEACHFVAVDQRQPDIQQDDIRAQLAQQFERGHSVMGCMHLVAQVRRRTSRLAAFLRLSSTTRIRRRGRSNAGFIEGLAESGAACGRLVYSGKPDREFTAVAGPLL